MKHKRIADDISAVSSIHSNVTRALRVRMPVKPKRALVPAQELSENATDFAPPLELSRTSIVITEPPLRPGGKQELKQQRLSSQYRKDKDPPSQLQNLTSL